MGLINQPNGHIQARIIGVDGKVHSEVFPTKREAAERLAEWKRKKRDRILGRSSERTLTVTEFFEEWFLDISQETAQELQSGWRKTQKQYFRDFIQPVLGSYRLRAVTPQMVKRVFIQMTNLGKAPQTQRLVYATLKKMFGDAIENYQYLTTNPVLKKLKPSVPEKEAPHLNIHQVKSLLSYVKGKKYGLAIWTQIFLGLRVSELIALKWEDIDLEAGRIHIRRTYVTKTGLFRPYPKGKKQHSHSIPPDLMEELAIAKALATTDFVVTSPHDNILPYKWYLKHLKQYCTDLGIPEIATHGLRHSTSELYIHHGATRDDLRRLFAHSTPAMTDRYVHDRGTNLDRVSNTIRLFPVGSDQKVTRSM